jgi:hypothetical protein
LLVDFDHRGHFRPLGEFVNGDVEIPAPSDDLEKWPQMFSPHTVKDHEGGIISSVSVGVWICLA